MPEDCSTCRRRFPFFVSSDLSFFKHLGFSPEILQVTTNSKQFVCTNCKLRKKKCDKVKPRCGYCCRKSLSCQYQASNIKQLSVQPKLALDVSTNPIIRSSLLLSNTLSEVLLSQPTNVQSTLYLRVLSIIRTTSQTLEDIVTRYFRGIHSFIPMLSRSRVERCLVDHSTPPPAGFSVLLLSMCLITYHPDFVPPSAHPLDQETLYLTTKSLFALVQASFPPSLHLIQASIIIATYEYANGRIHDAFASMGVCARIGYAAHIDSAIPVQGMEVGEYQEAEEKASTWWGIVIWERTILCEIANLQRPLTTRIPGSLADYRDGTTLHKAGASGSESDTDAFKFSCAVQGTWLLDQVIKTLDMTDPEARYNQLHGLDHTIQGVLVVILNQSQGKGGIYCTAIRILLRSKEREERLKSSHAAMNTITKMVDEIAASHTSTVSLVDTIPPGFLYVIRQVLQYIRESETKVDTWDEVERRLSRASLKFEYRWGGRATYG
ncbi:conserved hypothetical protein [Talaromyces stipitatus ATCC 10500]|uniref:Zn(2)-C6 fungal-type domain-containing protein n=1 Tax=Talaromyces stipitatus (strain ATCC 10500 / CBS 375.48 / QM 6759 / NRRL 1006) TaxID=441959 RepID=B8LWH9_TALSN|nr:uncharacterized protein TSTA_076560 [Talaromyces stipitatus ATCC 10500]EED24290.1 conserved hypothetical protein [Talaromyces stipitatus ATCC 10500]